jgi:hypothetical protein
MWKTHRTVLFSSAALVVGLGVGSAVVPALAAQEPVLTDDQRAQLQQELEAYRSCLEQQGVTSRERPAEGSEPRRLSDEEIEALRAAHNACESVRPNRPMLSDEQRAQLEAQREEYRACLQAQGLTLPERPATSDEGARPGVRRIGPRLALNEEWRAAIQAAREACADVAPNIAGLGGPERPGGPGPGWPGNGPRGEGADATI